MNRFGMTLLIAICLFSQQVAAIAPGMLFQSDNSTAVSAKILCHEVSSPELAMPSQHDGSSMMTHQGSDCCQNACQCSLSGYQLMSVNITGMSTIPTENGRQKFITPGIPQAPENSHYRPPITL